jgi:uncharacterized protein DUF5666
LEPAMDPIRSFLPRVFARGFLAQCAAAAVLLGGCGGGGGDAMTSSPSATTGSFAAGTITGFGSVIVNKVRFDDSHATVTDDDGNAAASSALRLGMRVEIQGGAVHDDGSGARCEARGIRFGPELVGPVESIDATAQSLVVLGQTVLVLDTTVIDDRLAGGFAAITVGVILDVHGTRDATTGTITATRIEPKPAAAGFRLKGTIANLDAGAKTFTIGAATISYAGVPTVPANLADGVLVKVRLQTAQVAGAWVATHLEAGGPRVGDGDAAEIEGTITAFTSTASFSVNGIPVDASSATFPDGTTAIVLGAHVEVHGTSSDGTVIATRVEVEDHARRHAEGFELHGAITAIDTAAQTFVLRGITVAYGGAGVEFRKGTSADLAVGAQVEARGILSADRTMLQATRISFGD